uniref:RRM domain-containing protein n=1 Tax=Mycena chlorophos TaxID=658473 RepID=A0ABQ0MCN7_MYCCL|nr:predicted protein [Mycena chlorophos]
MFAAATRACTRRAVRSHSTQTTTNRLFVGGLSFSADDRQLERHFATAGKVVRAEVAVHRKSGNFRPRSRGFGHVEFATVRDAENAMSVLNGTEIDGRAIRLDYAKPFVVEDDLGTVQEEEKETSDAEGEGRKVVPPSSTLWVGNLKYATTEETLEEFWGVHEGFQRVRIPQTRDGASSGMAFVKFADVESAKRARSAVGQFGEAVLDGRRLIVDFAAETRFKKGPGLEGLRDDGLKFGRDGRRSAQGTAKKRFGFV